MGEDKKSMDQVVVECGLLFPPEAVGRLNHPDYALDARAFCKVLLNMGSLPFLVQLNLAGIVEDSLGRGVGLYEIEQGVRRPGQLRMQVHRLDTAVAVGNLLNNVSSGVTSAVTQKVEFAPVPVKLERANTSASMDSHTDSLTSNALAESQVCGGNAGAQQKKFYFRNAPGQAAFVL